MAIQTPTSITDVEKLLKGARFLQSAELKALAIEYFPKFAFSGRGPEIVALCFQYRTRKGFLRAYKDLLDTSWLLVSDHIADQIPNTVLKRTFIIQQEMNVHKARVALEEPQIQKHDSDCRDSVNCAADWHSLWWNIVGTGLLNGRNPLSYSDAVQRLLTVESIGQMNQMCFRSAMNLAETNIGWNHRYDLMDLAAKEVERYIVEDEAFI